jgi:hypothetical protein
MEPDIVKQLRSEEKQGLLKTKSNINKTKDIELILELQNCVVKDFLSDIKQGKIKADRNLILSLNELSNYYNSEIWKVTYEKISIDKQILSFYQLVNTYIENLENSFENKDSNNKKNLNETEIQKLKNIILTLNSIKK